MVAIRRWEPRGGLRRANGHLDFWGPRMDLFHSWPSRHHSHIVAPVDIYEEGDRLVVKAAVPGFKAEDLDLTIEDNILTIKGETKSDTTGEEGNFLHRERVHGAFRRSFRLPEKVDAILGASSYEDGVLTVTFPHREEMRPKQLKIEVGKGASEGDAS